MLCDVEDISPEELPDIEELHGDLRLLAELVGVPQAIRIGMAFNGVPLRLWGMAKLKRRWRDNRIRRQYDQGVSVIDLARQYKTSDRQIWDILGRVDAPKDERQLGLF